MSKQTFEVLDPLYGDITFCDPVGRLIFSPAVQRLRHIRLSNIDSLTMPGIANISRFEHVLGTLHLANETAYVRRLNCDDAYVLQAAALLHDWAITPSGHLIEEGLTYIGETVNHEDKLTRLLEGEDKREIGGAERQLLYGREASLTRWAQNTFGATWQDRLRAITDAIAGTGTFGGCIAGQLDLDNIDNVCRVAWHMGLRFDRALPLAIARAIVGCRVGTVLVGADAVHLIEKWLRLRGDVYDRLMMSKLDFAGKLMIIHSAIWAYEDGIIQAADWSLTDHDYFVRLLSCKSKRVREVVERWLCGEAWAITELKWFEGQAPDFRTVHALSAQLTSELGKPLYAYRIQDKRTRKVELYTEEGDHIAIGKPSASWLLGVGTTLREPFSNIEQERVFEVASRYLNATPVATTPQLPMAPIDLFAQ